ncbi:S8 family peptidase [Bacteriovorax sp. Seq25_V]|uniref:S8 family peptidase n=1 Tax=Bacteriovorax sp. Seq25_V TaxID=1201288 RepID=UPI00038A0809|nr:S8 family peptidase [Bacteriovorax sp. Seq25_V]EQC47741.1 peptidase, S8/S53 family [Bacteriovorax sp. Seq25_V]
MFKATVGLCLLGTLSVSASSDLKINNTRLIVKLKNENASLVSDSIRAVMPLFSGYQVIYSDNIEKLKAELESNNLVESVNFDYFAGRSKLEVPEFVEKLTPSFEKATNGFNDPGISRLWAFKSADRAGMNVSDAYEAMGSQTGEEVVVAVVDTGVDYNHEDLKEVMWVNAGEIPGNGIDDDENGYIDDVHGINTLVRDADGNATADIMDKHSHGTHVSGTIAAKQNNGLGIAGVAANARIMGIRTVPNSGDETDVDVAESFLYAAKNGAKIINCSFGKSHNEGGMLVKETIDYIGREYGVLVVAAAGNESSNIDRYKTWPASYESENLLVVASTTKYGSMSGFSNYGVTNVDVAAPGSSIYSTTPGNRYGNMSGTSMATPNTVGVAAQILSLNPGMSPYELKARIMENSTTVSKYSNKVGSSGLVNLLDSMR